MNAISIEHLSKVYRLETKQPRAKSRGEASGTRRWWLPSRSVAKEVWALRDISLEVSPGAIVGIIGNNGAGKTTLLRVLSRVTLPTSGRAVVRGRVASLLGLGHGFQEELSARENIYLSAALYGIPQAEVDRRFDDIIGFAGLGEFVDNPVGRFSSGMFLRLAFSVAVNMQPDVILADEVLAVGDISFQEQCLERVYQAGAEGAAVLFVSHDMRAIERLCHRAIRLERGRMVDQGEPQEVIERYETALQSGALDRGKKSRSSLLRVLSLRLTTPDGREIESPRSSEEFLVSMVFQTHQPGLRARMALSISCGEVLVLHSPQPRDVLLEFPGTWTTSIRVPAGMLNDRVYGAKIMAEVFHDASAEPVIQNSRVSFRVYDDGLAVDEPSLLGGLRHSQMAVINPRLEWSLADAGTLAESRR